MSDCFSTRSGAGFSSSTCPLSSTSSSTSSSIGSLSKDLVSSDLALRLRDWRAAVVATAAVIACAGAVAVIGGAGAGAGIAGPRTGAVLDGCCVGTTSASDCKPNCCRNVSSAARS